MIPRWAVCSLLAAICWGISYTACSEAIKKIDRASYVLLSCLTSVLLYGIWGDVIGTLRMLSTDRKALTAFVLADLSGALAGYLTYLAISEKNATLVASLEITYPVWCAVIACVFLGQVLSWTAICGMFLVFLGVCCVVAGE